MSTVRQRFPADRVITAETLVAESCAAAEADRLAFGDPRMVAFLDAVGRRLLATPSRRYRELAPLGFFLRAAHLRRALAAAHRDRAHRRAPLGLVFHVPPGNVETMFAYGWAMSALAGNPNVVRLPSRASDVVDHILAALHEALPGRAAVIGDTQRLVAFDRDDEVVSTLSNHCRLRVLWGGDTAIGDLRRATLPAFARDITFPDRTSMSVLSSTAWLTADDKRRDRVIHAFHNDAYWYDQAACSSPRTVVFVGAPADCADAEHGFFAALAQHVGQSPPAIDAAAAMYTRTAVRGLVVDGVVERVRVAGLAVTVAELSRPYRVPDGWLGPGTFSTAHVATLTDLVAMLERRHQTVTHFGFDATDINEVATEAARRGVDRIVPVGEALSFEDAWDGYDLLHQFSRTVTVRTPAWTR
jgi:hypothetical protein